jgi:hypothetical protein
LGHFGYATSDTAFHTLSDGGFDYTPNTGFALKFNLCELDIFGEIRYKIFEKIDVTIHLVTVQVCLIKPVILEGIPSDNSKLGSLIGFSYNDCGISRDTVPAEIKSRVNMPGGTF